MTLRGAERDLQIAERATSEMSAATQFTEFWRLWQDYLFRIERAWEAAHRAVKGRPGFQQWFEPYRQHRARDPLLVFLKQARNAETHSIAPTVDQRFKLQVQDRYGYPFLAPRISTELEEGVLTINIETAAQDALLDFVATPLPSAPALVRILNRGKWYEPPTTHLGEPLKSTHPVDVAKLGLAFYGAFIKESAFKFR